MSQTDMQGRSHVFCFGGDEQWHGAPMIANKGAESQSCLKTAMINDMQQ